MNTLTPGLRAPALSTMTLTALLTLAACGNSTTVAGTGGPVSGPADKHCAGQPAQATSQSVCHLTSDAGAGGSMTSDYGVTMDDSAGDDDDCKYHVSWTATPIAENEDVTFTVVATTLTDGKPVPGAAPKGYSMAEVFLNDVHPGPNTNQVAKESPAGTYAVGPIQFDAPGKWTVRFHLFEDCSDLSPESPHGHAAFYVQVP